MQTAGARLNVLISLKDFIQKVMDENFQYKVTNR